jgi:hypothetical protein
MKEETKTFEDEEDPGVVPIIEPLRVVLDAIKPENASGWMFPNTIGGALDLDNLAYRVIKPIFKANGLKRKGWHAYRRGLRVEETSLSFRRSLASSRRFQLRARIGRP